MIVRKKIRTKKKDSELKLGRFCHFTHYLVLRLLCSLSKYSLNFPCSSLTVFIASILQKYPEKLEFKQMNKWSEQVICWNQYSSLYLWINQPPEARGSQKPSKQTLAVFSSFALHGLGSPNDQRKTRRTPSEEKDTSLSKSNVEYVVNVESVAFLIHFLPQTSAITTCSN